MIRLQDGLDLHALGRKGRGQQCCNSVGYGEYRPGRNRQLGRGVDFSSRDGYGLAAGTGEVPPKSRIQLDGRYRNACGG